MYIFKHTWHQHLLEFKKQEKKQKEREREREKRERERQRDRERERQRERETENFVSRFRIYYNDVKIPSKKIAEIKIKNWLKNNEKSNWLLENGH